MQSHHYNRVLMLLLIAFIITVLTACQQEQIITTNNSPDTFSKANTHTSHVQTTTKKTIDPKDIVDLALTYEENAQRLKSNNIDYTYTIHYVLNPNDKIISIDYTPSLLITIEKKLTKEKTKWLQEQLKIAGYYLVIDGEFNNKTKNALVEYTTKHMLKSATHLSSVIEEHLIAYNKTRLAGDINNYLVLVNKQKNLLSTDIPKDLVPITVNHMPHVKEIKAKVNDALTEMFADAKKDGVTLRVISGYRSFEYQVNLFKRYSVKSGVKEANTYSGFPGQSEHQTGMVVDLDDGTFNYTLKQSFDKSKAYKWLDANAHKYGFILRYLKGKEDITQYIYEPWHYRYIDSVEIATYIHDNHLTLEEYLEQKH